MDKQELIAALHDIVKPYVRNPQALENLSEDTGFINDLKINSANLVDVILDIEERFDITIDNESMEKMLDVRSAVNIISEKLSL